jgi:hypothetical protein
MSAEEGGRTGGPPAAGELGSLGEDIAALVQREVEQVVASIREELDQLREEAVGRAGEAARGTALIGAAGALGLASAGALASLPLLALRRVLPGWAVALLVAGGTATAAAFLARSGLERLEAAAPEAVRERVQQARHEVGDVLKQRAAGAEPDTAR